MKLELKHLAPYLPYGLEFILLRYDKDIFVCQGLRIHKYSGGDYIMAIHENGEYNISIDGDWYKPILRLMSDLTRAEFKQIWEDSQCEKEEDDWVLEAISGGHIFCYADFQNITYRGIETLLANHFDVFGLITAGLAIDINTIKLF